MALSRISSAAIANNAVIAADILDGSLTGAKLAANTVSGDKLGQSAVSSNNIVSGISIPALSGNTAFNTNTLFVDATNSRVGVGTVLPNTPLTVATTGNFSGSGVRVVAKAAPGTYYNELTIQNDGTVGGLINTVNYLATTIDNSEQMRLTSAGLLKFNSGYGSVATAYGCRAWVNINGGGTPSIRASGNMSSITDYGDSFYGLNFATAIVDGNYAWAFGGSNVNDGTGSNFTGFITTTSNQSASSLAIKGLNIYNGGANFTGDTAIATISIFR